MIFLSAFKYLGVLIEYNIIFHYYKHNSVYKLLQALDLLIPLYNFLIPVNAVGTERLL